MDGEWLRWVEIKALWRANPGILHLTAGFILGLIFFPAIQLISVDYVDFLSSLAPEAVGIIFTVAVIDRLYTWRDEKRQVRELKERLEREARGTSMEMASRAIDELRERGWLFGEESLLKGKMFLRSKIQETHLEEANLENADFYQCNLHSVYFNGANLRGVTMMQTSLNGSNLQETDLSNSRLEGCDLRGTILTLTMFIDADLRKADFSHSQLWDTDFSGANLEGANFYGAKLIGGIIANNSTILPDGTNWVRGTDMRRFGCVLSYPNFE